MSDAPVSTATAESSSAAAETALVAFDTDAESATGQFADSLPSEWAFAAHEATMDGDAIDGLREPDSDGLLPLVAVATLLAAETELYADAEDDLIAMTPTPLAFDSDGGTAGIGEESGMAMWSGESDSVIGSPLVHAGGGIVSLALHDIVPHGISLDWTDTLLMT